MSSAVETRSAAIGDQNLHLRTLVACGLVAPVGLTERFGRYRGTDLINKHARLTRALVHLHGGREAERDDGFLLIFDRPIQAVAFALDHQRSLVQLSAVEDAELTACAGIDIRDMPAREREPDGLGSPLAFDPLVADLALRLQALALPGQILLTSAVYAIAQRACAELGAKIETVRWRQHGRYRLAGLADAVPVCEVGEDGVAPLRAPTGSTGARPEVPMWRRPLALATETMVLAALLAVPVYVLIRPAPAIAFANRDWIVVGDLKNLTGKEAYDESLRAAFRIGLEQSRYVNVLSDPKVRETVRRMQRDPGTTTVDRSVGSEVAIREGARALVLPTVANVDGRVRITIEVIDPRTQTTVYSESVDGTGTESLLPALDTINQRLRMRLGETLAMVSSASQPLEQVATRNLDALRAYSLAQDYFAKERADKALPLFRRALDLDPEFALARLGVARIYMSSGRNAEATLEFKAATASSERLSPRESAYLDAWLATFDGIRPALDKWKQVTDQYPDYFAAYGGYAYAAWRYANRYDLAIEAARASASERNAYRVASDHLLGILYLGSERYDEAERNFAIAEAGGLVRLDQYAALYATQREYDKAEAMLARWEPSGQASADAIITVARIVFTLDRGRWNDAGAMLDAARTRARKLGDLRLQQIYDTIDVTLHSQDSGRDERRVNLAAYLQVAVGQIGKGTPADDADREFQILLAAYLAARDGDPALAARALAVGGAWADDGRAVEDPHSSLANMRIVAEAEQLRASGRAAEAVEHLRSRIDGSELCVTHVALMDALAATGNFSDALAEAQWLATHRGRAYTELNGDHALTAFNVLQSNLALLRAAEFSTALQQPEQAHEALATLLKAWPQAPTVPPAAARLARLKVVR